MKTTIPTPFETIAQEAMRLTDNGIPATEIYNQFPAWKDQLSELFATQEELHAARTNTPAPETLLTQKIIEQIAATHLLHKPTITTKFILLKKIKHFVNFFNDAKVIIPLCTVAVCLVVFGYNYLKANTIEPVASTQQSLSELTTTITKAKTEQVINRLQTLTETENALAAEPDNSSEIISTEDQLIDSYNPTHDQHL